MAGLRKWTVETLNQYIQDRVEEDLHLDYKAADALIRSDEKRREIAKDVSAFANSDGGVIIYGIKEDPAFKHLPSHIDPIDRGQFSKETLEQVINSGITPRVHGIVITPIIVDLNNDNVVVYVVEIPQSITAHQIVKDKRYYRRYNFESIPMDDWEIKDVINRQTKCLVEISFRPKMNKSKLDTYANMDGADIPFEILASNIGNKVVLHLDCMIRGSRDTINLISPRRRLIEDQDYFEMYYTNENENERESPETPIQRMAILPGTYRSIGSITFLSDIFRSDIELEIVISLDDNLITRKIKPSDIYSP